MDIQSEPEEKMEVRVPAEETVTVEMKVPALPKVEEVAKLPFHVHHGLVGMALVAIGATFAVAAPVVRPTTKIVVGGALAIGGLALIWDDYMAHAESNCGIESWFSFVPCPEKVENQVVTIRK